MRSAAGSAPAAAPATAARRLVSVNAVRRDRMESLPPARIIPLSGRARGGPAAQRLMAPGTRPWRPSAPLRPKVRYRKPEKQQRVGYRPSTSLVVPTVAYRARSGPSAEQHTGRVSGQSRCSTGLGMLGPASQNLPRTTDRMQWVLLVAALFVAPIAWCAGDAGGKTPWP